MTFRFLILLLVIASLGSSTFFYFQTRALEKSVHASKALCELKASQLEKNYQAKIDELLAEVPQQRVIRKTITKKLERPPLEEMVSYGHQVRAISNKYEFLLKTAQIEASDKKRLGRLLLEREKLAQQVNNASTSQPAPEKMQEQLASIEQRIENLLTDPIDYSRYEYLKERNL